MKRYFAILLCIILVSGIRKVRAQEVEYQNVKYEIIDGHKARAIRVVPYEKMLHIYSGKVFIPDSIYIDNNVYNVADVTDAFRGSKYLKEVRLPQGLTYILNSAFYECRSLQEIILPDSIICIYSFAFFNCRSMRSVTFPANLQKIMDSAFEGCTSLKEIEIPQHVAVIEESAFARCSHLKRLVIPQSVDTIGYFAFGGCKGLREIYVYATIPPAIKGENGLPSAFDGVRKSIAVHIPQGTKPLYLQAKEWSSFTNYIDDL